ncbi:MAG: holo-ACP synthase [Gemmatimonadetes bacterium]|nr:holo-ACP synthase [Gemmatimonadota bacterium]
MILGLGIDLVEVARVEALVARHPVGAAARLFTDGEWGYAATKARPALHLAARFAAKEAAFKALAGSDEARAIGWRDIEVVRAADGAPTLVLHGRAEARARVLGVRTIHLSLTHTADTAAAVVILWS